MLGNKFTKRARAQHGQIELFAGLLVVSTMALVGYIYFLVDSGMSAFYKQRLQYVTAQGANFAASYSGGGREGATRLVVQELCDKMGLRASELTVNLTDTTVNGKPSYSCSAEATLPLLPGTVLPGTVTLSAASTAAKPGGAPDLVLVHILGIGNYVNNPFAKMTGAMLGIGNRVVGKKSEDNGSGLGLRLGIGNLGSGSGSSLGIGNINQGSGNSLGIGNALGGSGNALGIGNFGSGSGNMLGIGNSWE